MTSWHLHKDSPCASPLNNSPVRSQTVSAVCKEHSSNIRSSSGLLPPWEQVSRSIPPMVPDNIRPSLMALMKRVADKYLKRLWSEKRAVGRRATLVYKMGLGSLSHFKMRFTHCSCTANCIHSLFLNRKWWQEKKEIFEANGGEVIMKWKWSK